MTKKVFGILVFLGLIINSNLCLAESRITNYSEFKVNCNRQITDASSKIRREFSRIAFFCLFNYYVVEVNGSPSYSSSSLIYIPERQSSISSNITIPHPKGTYIRFDSVYIFPVSDEYLNGFANQVRLTDKTCIQKTDFPKLITTRIKRDNSFITTEVDGKFKFTCN